MASVSLSEGSITRKPSHSRLIEITRDLLLTIKEPEEVAQDLSRLQFEEAKTTEVIDAQLKHLKKVLGVRGLLSRLGDLLEEYDREAGYATGACDYDDLCREVTSAQCGNLSGSYHGDGTHCGWGKGKKAERPRARCKPSRSCRG